ncbi:MAG TPA: hypothetical protein VLH09_11900 [Bryobacteraceae bacterium]|nr:hypothetical protein [Bryobacteraceae bacterium]
MDGTSRAFVAFGPGIVARRIGRGELTDVAKAAAALLGIPLASAGGRDLLADAPACIGQTCK